MACAAQRPTVLAAPSVAVDTTMLGEFRDDYGDAFVITPQLWTQLPRARYHVVAWHPAEQFLIARNDSANASAPGLWTRIDWVRLEGMPPYGWAFCLSAYEAPSREVAETTSVAKRETPRTGCNGYPFSRMRRPTAGEPVAPTPYQTGLQAAPPTSPILPAGTRAWIRAPSMPLAGLRGRLLGERQDTILFRPDHRAYTYELARPEIRRIDLVTGYRRSTGTGFAIGGLLGMGLGGGFALGTSRDPGDLPRAVALGGAIGAVVGALIGRARRSEVWGPYAAPLRVAPLERP